MAITVLPYLSPRLLIVAAPDTEITVQEIIDQVRDWEDGEEGMAYPYIISAAGKENLGGGVTVGITCTLQNARIAFEARTTPTETGTATTADGTGLVLTDNTATFVSNGVTVGAHVVNKATGASGSVVSVDSETQLTLLQALGGSSRNDFQIGDDYAVHNIIPCTISGGNLVAVDDVGADLEPVFPTAWTQVSRTAASSSTLVGVDEVATNILTSPIENTITMEETLRIMLAALAGKASGANTTTMRFRDTGDTKDRIVATVDEFGNRSSVTLTPD